MMLLVLALVPVAVLLHIVYKSDKIEKESFGLLRKVFLWGVLSIASATVVGLALEALFGFLFEEDSILFIALDNFIATALVEESGKFYAVKRNTWKSPEFNYTFDGMVYAIVAALGFACVENLVYVFDEGDLGTAILRAFTAVPGHCVDAVFMGFFYGQARKKSLEGDPAAARRKLILAVIVPTLTHGFYDFCLFAESDFLYYAFVVFCLAVTIVSLVLFLRAAKKDTRIL